MPRYLKLLILIGVVITLVTISEAYVNLFTLMCENASHEFQRITFPCGNFYDAAMAAFQRNGISCKVLIPCPDSDFQ